MISLDGIITILKTLGCSSELGADRLNGVLAREQDL